MDEKLFLELLFILLILSFFVYVLYLYILIKYKKKDDFKSPFFTICIFVGVQDFMFLAQTWVFLKLPILGWFGADRLIRRFPVICARCFKLFSFQSSIGGQIRMAQLAINRYTAICMPHYHDYFWSKKLIIPIMIMAQFLCPLPISIGHQFFDIYLIYPIHNITGAIGAPYYNDPTGQLILSSVLASIHFVNIILMLVLYGSIMKRLRQHSNQVASVGMESEFSNTDKKLAFFGICLFIINLMFVIFYCGMTFVSPEKDISAFLFVVRMYMISGDFLAYCNPWFMLLFSRSVRNHFWGVIRCKEPTD